MRTISKVAPANDESSRLYCTSDGLAFLDEREAVCHSDMLTDKTITNITCQQADAEILRINNSNWLGEMEELLNDLEWEGV